MMRRLGELRWRAVAGEIEVEVQDQVNRSGRPRDPNLPDIHTLVCLEFIRNAAATIEALAENNPPPGLTRGRDRAWMADQDAAGRFILRQDHDGALLPKLEQQVNPLTIAHEQVLHAVSDVCFDLLAERGIAREQVVAFFQQLDTAAREADVASDE
ncbi:MAG: hypothetical protein ACTHNK_06110 [Thermomicrobiales bacterium]